MNDHRTALLIRCTDEEAQLIRHAAKKERRSISGYVLNAVLQRIANKNSMLQRMPESLKRNQAAVARSD